MRVSDVKDLKYKLLQGSDSNEYTSLVYNSRKVTEGCLFVCIKGLHFDAHDVIGEIKANGASGVIIEHECDYPEGIDVYLADNTRSALALCSAAHFGYPAKKLKTIAITGTKGKTTTAYMIKHLLEKAGRKCGYIGTNGERLWFFCCWFT